MGAEAAAVRIQYVSGTHAIASALFGCLRCELRRAVLGGALVGEGCKPAPCSSPSRWWPLPLHSRPACLPTLPPPSACPPAAMSTRRPGDELLAVAGAPYDTLEEVIGLRGTPGIGSLADLGVTYRK